MPHLYHAHITERDEDLLIALARCPLTASQALKASAAFRSAPFDSIRTVRDRLQQLRETALVDCWPYAMAGPGSSPLYYRLTKEGYRIVHGESAQIFPKRMSCELPVARHAHTERLSEFIVHTIVSAHRRGVPVIDFRPENSVRLPVGPDTLFPDCAFKLPNADGKLFTFYVELDNGTERLRSGEDTDSWQRKITLYNSLQDQIRPDRFRVLAVAARSAVRVRSILDVALQLAVNPQRSLIYAVYLDDFLRQPDPLFSACFLDHCGRLTPLLHQRPQLPRDPKVPILLGTQQSGGGSR